MSIGSLGIVGSVAAGQLQQTRNADSDRAVQDHRSHAQDFEAAKEAEAAEGIGKTTEEGKTSDRDADGRRLWERPTPKAIKGNEPDGEAEEPARSLDPTGEAGGQIDLCG